MWFLLLVGVALLPGWLEIIKEKLIDNKPISITPIVTHTKPTIKSMIRN